MVSEEREVFSEIKRVLSDGEWKSITEIAKKCRPKRSTSTVSKYLGILKAQDTVEEKKEATMRKFKLKKKESG